MRTSITLAFVLLAATVAPLRASEVLDRIVATVNGGVVLASELDEAVRFESLVEGRPLAQVTAEDLQACLSRLIDQELLRQQMAGLSSQPAGAGLDGAPGAVADRLAQVRKLYSATADRTWREVLERYGLNESQLARHLEEQSRIMRFVDTRLRPEVRVEPEDVAAYYKEKLLPRLRQGGATLANEPPLAEVQGQIQDILREQRIDELLSAWLHNLRNQSAIRIELEDGKSPVQQAGQPAVPLESEAQPKAK